MLIGIACVKDHAALVKQLSQARETLLEYAEEINDMKSERNNTRVSADAV